MKPYSETNTEEKESYPQYCNRKRLDWKERLRGVFIEARDSSLKEDDKERFVVDMARKILNNDLSHNNWKDNQ